MDLICDVETVPLSWAQDLSTHAREAMISRHVRKGLDYEAAEAKAIDQLSLLVPYAKIVAIGLMAVENHQLVEQPRVLLLADPQALDDYGDVFVEYHPSETTMYSRFWKIMGKAHRLVTFNGRSFDGPLLMHRSLKSGVAPRKNLVPYRYSFADHLDLCDALTCFGATERIGLQLWCEYFGVRGKSDGVNGSMVQQLYTDGDFVSLIRYLADDLAATTDLYRVTAPLLALLDSPPKWGAKPASSIAKDLFG